jgi:hypothetical protein
MGTLEQGLQEIRDAKIGVCITWLWDGGVDVRLQDHAGKFVAETQIETVDKVLPWLRSALQEHRPSAAYEGSRHTTMSNLEAELQQIYDSEINIEISWIGDGPIAVKLGNEFYGFGAEETVPEVSEVLPWLQRAIHEHYPESKYDVERLGGKWEAKWFGPKDYTVNGKPIEDGDSRR